MQLHRSLRSARGRAALRLLALTVVLLSLGCATTSRTDDPAAPTRDRPELAMRALEAVAVEPEDVYIRVVDVGPGLCTITRAPGPRFMIYDIGHWNGRECHQAAEELVTTGEVDLLILSHSDSDHLGDGKRILDDFRVKQIWRTGFRRDDTQTWKKLNAAIAREVRDEGATVINLATVDLVPGTQIELGPATVTLVAGWHEWPFPGPTSSERRNAISIVARLDYNGSSVLYTGDTVGRRLKDGDSACKDAEKIMVDRHEAGETSLEADVIVAPHHGGNNGSSACFIEAVSPTHVVFSAGHDHQHPTAGAAERYRAAGVSTDNIYRTDRSDDEPGDFEWKEGSVSGCRDGRGDDDVEIALREDGTVELDYRNSDGDC